MNGLVVFPTFFNLSLNLAIRSSWSEPQLVPGLVFGDCCRASPGLPSGSDSKVSACSAGDLGSIPGLGRSPGEGNGNPLQYSLPGKFHGLRTLVGYSPWGRKESDMTERLHFHFLS